MSNKRVGVDCTFAEDGSVRVRRLQIDGKWQVVEQGRQWLDKHGRHVLIMLPGNEVRQITLRPESMTWQMVPVGGRSQVV